MISRILLTTVVVKLTSDLIILVLAVFNTGNVDSSLVWEDLSAGREVPITRVENSVQHALVKEEVSHPLGNNDVDLREGKIHLFHLSLQQGDLIGHAVDGNDLTSLFDDGRHVDTDNVFRAGTDGEPVEAQRLVVVIRILSRMATHMLRMPVPQPTSRTTLSLKMCLFW